MNKESIPRWLSRCDLPAAMRFPCLALAVPFAHVPNEKPGTVSLIDTASDAVSTEIPVGELSKGVVIL